VTTSDWATDPTTTIAAEKLLDFVEYAQLYARELKQLADDSTTVEVTGYLTELTHPNGIPAFARSVKAGRVTDARDVVEAGLSVSAVPAPRQLTPSSEYLDKITLRIGKVADYCKAAVEGGCAASRGTHADLCHRTPMRQRFGMLRKDYTVVEWTNAACPYHASRFIAPTLVRAFVVDTNGPWTDAIHTPTEQD
jgi:hypothetical protein